MSESLSRRKALGVVAAALSATAVSALALPASIGGGAPAPLDEPDALTSYRDFMRATAHLTEHQKGKLADALEALQS